MDAWSGLLPGPFTSKTVDEIFIDGTRVGEAPIGEQTVTLGIREVLVKHGNDEKKRIEISEMAAVTPQARIALWPER